MKKRNSFVANSSSSSFLISHKGNTKVKLVVEIDLANYGREIDNDRGVNRLCEENGYDEATKAMLLAEIAAGRTVVECHFSTEEGGIESYIADEGRGGDAPKHLFSEAKVKFIDPTYED